MCSGSNSGFDRYRSLISFIVFRDTYKSPSTSFKTANRISWKVTNPREKVDVGEHFQSGGPVVIDESSVLGRVSVVICCSYRARYPGRGFTQKDTDGLHADTDSVWGKPHGLQGRDIALVQCFECFDRGFQCRDGIGQVCFRLSLNLSLFPIILSMIPSRPELQSPPGWTCVRWPRRLPSRSPPLLSLARCYSLAYLKWADTVVEEISPCLN